MTKDNDTIGETIKLFDKEGLADLMTLLNNESFVGSVQLGANLVMLGLVQLRVFSVPENEILDSVKAQLPLADWLIEVLADADTTDATGT
jgi:hypothetical protein